jgi:hypothetical protein
MKKFSINNIHHLQSKQETGKIENSPHSFFYKLSKENKVMGSEV